MSNVGAKQSAWRFLKLALQMRAPEPAFRHILITLASYANQSGSCYPSYASLQEATGYASKQTISAALNYWREAGVITWTKGWGNTHRSRPNVYQFHEEAMQREAMKAQSVDSAEILESPLSREESPLRQFRKSTEAGMKVHSVDAKVLAMERPSKLNVPDTITPGSETFLENSGGQNETATQSQKEESPLNEISSESTVSELSSSRIDWDAIEAKHGKGLDGLQ